MNISIFGLGYVGTVTAACLSDLGNRIIGVDVNSLKAQMLNDGIPPIIEENLQNLLSKGKTRGLISGTTDTRAAIMETELSIICVGTPSRANGSLNTQFLENVCGEIGDSLKYKCAQHILVFRSTMLPGTMRDTVIPKLEASSGKKAGKDFFAAFHPEFLREATAIHDFMNPPKTVVGCDNQEIADIILSLYEKIPGPKLKTDLETAEMVKYVDNNFHALKITFANEIGHLCRKLGIDSHQVMDIFVQDKKLNISPMYLKPGFAFGGSCLPKDLRAISYLGKMLDVETPLLNSLLVSNNAQILSAIRRVISFEKRKIGIAGFTFKEGTDDLRESPLIEVIETLLGKGYSLKLYDRNVALSKLVGANMEYINRRIPHIASLMVDSLDELIEDREVIIIGNRDAEFYRIIKECREDQIIFDMVRMGDKENAGRNYFGVCW